MSKRNKPSKGKSKLPKTANRDTRLDELLGDVPDDVKPIIRDLKPKDAEIILTMIKSSSVSYSGPLPTPEYFQGYENVVPGSAERILRMAETQSEHRKRQESKVIDGQLEQNSRGQIFAFILSLVCLGIAIYFATLGHPELAGKVLTVTVVGLAGVFLANKFFTRKSK